MRQAAGQQRHAVAQRQHDEGQRRRQVECRRGQEGDAQHPHGAPPQFVGRRGQRARLGLGLAVQHDGGDPAHAVEEARLQPGERQELAARGRRGADTRGRHRDRHQQPAQDQHQPRQAIGQQRGKRHQGRAGNREHRGRQPAGEQPVQRLDPIDHDRGQFARMLRAQQRRAGMQQARQRIAAQPPPRRRTGIERRAVGRHREPRPQQRQHRERRQRRRQIRRPAAQRGREHTRGTIGLADRQRGARQPAEHDRPRRARALAQFAPQPRLCCRLAGILLRLRHGGRLIPTAQTNDLRSSLASYVMAGHIPSIPITIGIATAGRDKPGHDGESAVQEPLPMAIGIRAGNLRLTGIFRADRAATAALSARTPGPRTRERRASKGGCAPQVTVTCRYIAALKRYGNHIHVR